MFDVNQITSTLRGMGDRALQQYAMMNKGNPYILSLAVSESNQRKQLRTAAQARAMAPRPKVVDQDIANMAPVDAMGNVTGALPEDQGIGRLSAPNIQRMADGGIAGFDESTNAPITTQRLDNMGKTGGMFNYAQDGGGVMRMSGGGMPGYAGGVFNSASFREFLKAKNIDEKAFSSFDFSEKEKVLNDFKKETSGPQKVASKPTPTTATPTAAPSAAPAKSFEAGQKYGPTLTKIGDTLSNIGTTKTSKLPLGGSALSAGLLGAVPAVYEGYTQRDFYDDPNVSTVGKAKQALGTAAKVGIPTLTTGLGSLFGPLGTAGGMLGGGALTAYLDSSGMLTSKEYEDWKKANPEATPEQAKKAAAKIIPTYSPDQQANAEAQRLGLKVNPNTMSKPVEAADVADTSGGGGKGGGAGRGGAGAGSSAQSIKDMYALFAGDQNKRDTQLNDIERQYKELAESKTSAAQRDYNQLQTDLAAQGEYGKDKEAKLKAKEERVGKEEGQAGGLALLEAGLAMMSGTSQHAFANIGQGAMAGTAAYRKSMEKIADARDKLDDAYGRLEDVRFNQKNMNAKELRAAKKDIDNATNSGLESLINFTAKRFDITTDQAKTMFGGAVNLEQSRIAAAPGIARNKMLEKRFSGDEKKMAEYTKVQRQVMSDLKNDTNYASATPEVQAKLMQTRMRQAMLNNPFLSSYAMGIGFESSPTSKGARNEDDDI